tara:strand:+ start:672 stop:1907 length:1236 start_codon:yes stop_codon:yes gene_type:complete
MSDVPPKKDAFVVLMSKATPVCPPNDPWHTAVIYTAHLEHVDESEPLWRVPYFGQTVRAESVDENFKTRKREHESDTVNKPKDLGFHAVIGAHGADKIEWRVLSSKSGRRSEMQEWANAEEIRLIDAHGGVLRDMDTKLQQTLNLTKGGQGDAAVRWAGIESRRRRALNQFKAAMEKYVDEFHSSLVPRAYVDEDKYPLGKRLTRFRQGEMRKGMSDQADIDAWAKALPKWHWDARESDEYREGKSQRAKDQAKREEEADPGGHSRRRKDWWRNATEEQKAALTKTQSDARNLPDVHAASVQRGKDQAVREEEADPGCRSRRHKDWCATERRAELERARPIAVPFVKSKKRRKEMRAASTDFSGRRGNAVLYMISEDGKTIRSVNTEGDIRESHIVGPVVDPAPPDAFDSD